MLLLKKDIFIKYLMLFFQNSKKTQIQCVESAYSFLQKIYIKNSLKFHVPTLLYVVLS